jgi:hypothetical protein
MDSSPLNRLASGGFAGFAPDEASELADSTREQCASTGDARYCFIADTLELLDRWWTEHESAGGVPRSIAESIDEELKASLPEILAEVRPADGTTKAKSMCDRIRALLTGPSEWLARGDARGS